MKLKCFLLFVYLYIDNRLIIEIKIEIEFYSF